MDIKKELNEIVSNYKGGTVEIVDGLHYSQYDTLKRVEFYYNSRYLNGDKDNAGRTKPFMNINKAKLNVAVRATDFDTKDIRVTSDKPHSYIKSMVFSHELYQWMKRTNYGKSLNKQTETRAKYGGLLVKKVVRDGEVYIEVPEWNNLITDQVDVMRGAIIECHYMTPVELAEKLPYWNQEVSYEDAVKYLKKKGKEFTSQDTFPVYEVHGQFNTEYITDKDDYYYSQQFYIILGDAVGKQIVLHKEEEKELPYKYLAWNDVPGRALGVGVIEDGFNAQVWVNDAILKQTNISEYASKVLFKSNNPSIGSNITARAESGDVIDISEGDITLVNTMPSSVPMFDNLITQWNDQYDKVASTFASNTGETMPSGTAFRQTLILNQEANSHFDYRKEEMGLFQQEIMTDWVLPHLAKKINKKHILSSEYSPSELKAINKAFALSKANSKFIDLILDGKAVTTEDYDNYVSQMEALTTGKPFLEVPDGYFTDFEPSISVITTGEQRNKAVQLESIFSIINAVSANPNLMRDPVLATLFSRLIEIADIGISPSALIEDMQASVQMQAQQQQAMQAQQMQQTLPTSMTGAEQPVA